MEYLDPAIAEPVPGAAICRALNVFGALPAASLRHTLYTLRKSSTADCMAATFTRNSSELVFISILERPLLRLGGKGVASLH